MKLSAYLDRIGYAGPATPTPEVLRNVHRCHAYAIAYENLDVLRGLPVDQDIPRIYQKIVEQGRGGWCYEMNGLLGWALDALGFSVTRQLGGVMREADGDGAWGNHLVLRVDFGPGDPWLADVGLGDGIAEAIPLTAGTSTQGDRTFRLEALSATGPGVEFRFHNAGGAMPPSFDLRYRADVSGADSDDEACLAARCETLQSDPESMFRQNLICQRMSERGTHILLGRVLTMNGERKLLGSADELTMTLRSVFDLQVGPSDDIWPAVLARHETLFGDTPVDELRFGRPRPGD